MTTIAWDGKHVCCDSQMSSSYIDQNSAQKIFKKKNKLYAASGTYSVIRGFVHDGKEIPDGSYLLEIDQNTGKGMLIEKDGSFPVKPPQALGSGSGFAMGALLNGASAAEAVKIAIKLDANSGGKVKTYKTKN